MTRRLILTLGLCLLPLGLVPPAASAQTPPPWTVATSHADEQDSQQPKPPTNTTTKQQDEKLAREKIAKEEHAQKEQAESADKKTQVSRVVRVGGPLGVIEDAASHAGPNVRIEFTLTDQRSGAPTTSKTVMLTTSNQNWGKLRSEVFSGVYGNAPLNVDVRPFVVSDGKISVQLTIDYSQGRMPDAEGNTEKIAQVRINESLTAILENGKPLLITQSADPISDRKVTVEVKATVLR